MDAMRRLPRPGATVDETAKTTSPAASFCASDTGIALQFSADKSFYAYLRTSGKVAVDTTLNKELITRSSEVQRSRDIRYPKRDVPNGAP